MGTSPVTCRTLEDFYYIDAHTFEKQYKEVLSNYRTWSELSHADEWLVFPENIGSNLAIDETSLSNGELYTLVTNRDRHGGEGCLVAVVSGTKAEDVIKALENIPEEKRESVTEITLDLSDSMRKIVRSSFPKARRVIDRFHIQKLACDAVQEMRIKHRWDAIQEANDEMENARLEGREYVPLRYENGDTKKELLARSRYLLFKSADKWTDRQKRRAKILFELYPDLKKALHDGTYLVLLLLHDESELLRSQTVGIRMEIRPVRFVILCPRLFHQPGQVLHEHLIILIVVEQLMVTGTLCQHMIHPYSRFLPSYD